MSRRCKRTSMQPLFISLDYLGVSALPLSTNLIFWFWNCSYSVEGPCVSMSYVVGLPINSYKPITNTAWVRARLCKFQKGCTWLPAASDKVYQLLAHSRSFSPCIPASSTTNAGRHDIVEIFLKVALNTINQIKSIYQNWQVLTFSCHRIYSYEFRNSSLRSW
jgi:hypothetical protein